MTLALAAGLIPILAAIALAVLPAGRLMASLDWIASLISLICVGLAISRPETPRVHGMAGLFLLLIALDGLGEGWLGRRRVKRSALRRACAQLARAAALLGCLVTDPILSWLALTVACAASLWPVLPRHWDHVPVAGGAIGLVLFGMVAGQLGGASPILSIGATLLGYGTLAAVLPGLLPLLLLLLLHLGERIPLADRDLTLLAVGTAALLCSGLALVLTPAGSRRLALLRLGQGGAAVAAFGCGGPAAVIAAFVQVALLVLCGIAIRVGRPGSLQRSIALSGLGGLQPVGMLPGIVLIIVAAAHHGGWPLLPVGLGFALLGWGAAMRPMGPRTWSRPNLDAAWIPLGLLLWVGWFLPNAIVMWLLGFAGAAP